MADNNAVFVDLDYFIALFNISDTLLAQAAALAQLLSFDMTDFMPLRGRFNFDFYN